MRAPRGLLIDLDDTLYAYAPRHERALAALTARAVALRVVDEPTAFHAAYGAARVAVKARLGGTAASHHRLLYVQGALERLVGHPAPAQALALYDAYWDAYLEGLEADPGAHEALLAFRAAGILLAFVTNLTTHIQLRKLERLGLGALAAQLVTSEEVGREKPAPAVFELALGKLGLTPSADVWVVGDSVSADVAGARQLGLRAVWFRRGPQVAPGEHGGASRPDAVVTDWAALRALALGGLP